MNAPVAPAAIEDERDHRDGIDFSPRAVTSAVTSEPEASKRHAQIGRLLVGWDVLAEGSSRLYGNANCWGLASQVSTMRRVGTARLIDMQFL